jgi:ribosomal protein L37E
VSASSDFRCSSCGHLHRARSWTELPTLRILTSAEVHEYVTTWPEEVVVAVRACSGCGAPMARTAQYRMRAYAAPPTEPAGR